VSKKIVFSILFILIGLGLTAYSFNNSALRSPASGSALTLTDSNGGTHKFSQTELLQHPALETINLPKDSDPAYPGLAMTYKAIKVSELFKNSHVDGNHVVKFECTDGFSAPLLPSTTEVALSGSSVTAVAYIAIENPSSPWPDLAKFHKGKHKGTAGPFYLVWVNPKYSSIGPEEWPFKLSGLKMVYSIEKEYPEIVPQRGIMKTSTNINIGYEVFVKNCFACHTLNKAGSSAKGPDLNFPVSPVEYLGRERLSEFIRDPESLRYWPKGQMASFSKAAINDQQLANLLDYFEHMAEYRP